MQLSNILDNKCNRFLPVTLQVSLCDNESLKCLSYFIAIAKMRWLTSVYDATGSEWSMWSKSATGCSAYCAVNLNVNSNLHQQTLLVFVL